MYRRLNAGTLLMGSFVLMRGNAVFFPSLELTLLEDVMPWVFVAFGGVIFVLLIYWSRKKEGPEEKEKREERPVTAPPKIPTLMEAKLPMRVERSITENEAVKAREELRILGVEKEIVDYALTHLYEAHAEGKLSDVERDRLVSRYQVDKKRVESKLTYDESVIGLHELERTQAELVSMFQNKFEEINRKIGEFRSQLNVAATEVKAPALVAPTLVAPVVEERERLRPTRRAAAEPVTKAPKTKVEEKIEEIRAEVIKELERLEQMETEG